jgi:dTDP-4-amino-4,6-dideoxygalactose transaminase
MLTTLDPELDRKFRVLRQHGMSVSDTTRHMACSVVDEEYPMLGFNYRMTDIQAAVGRVQLRRLPAFLIRRINLAAHYTERIKGIPGLIPPQVPAHVRTNYQSYAVQVTDKYPISRNQLMQKLLERGISTRRGIMNAHQEAAHKEIAHRGLTCSQAARDGVILLPLFAEMTIEEVDRVVDALTP